MDEEMSKEVSGRKMHMEEIKRGSVQLWKWEMGDDGISMDVR